MTVKTDLQNYKKCFVFMLMFSGIIVCLLTFSTKRSLYFSSYVNVTETKLIKRPPIRPGFFMNVGKGTEKYRGNCTKTLPKVIIIGASKCGTEAFTVFLGHHPNISIDPDIKKEVKFFNKHYDLGFAWYLQELPCTKPGQILVERSADYFYDVYVPERIWGMSSQTKIVLIVCEPVRRTISEFTMKLGMKAFNDTNIEHYLFVNNDGVRKINTRWYPLHQSNYSLNFARWMRVFPLKQMHVVDGDLLRTQPWVEMAALEQFLELKPFYEREKFVLNTTRGFFCFETNSYSKPKCMSKSKGTKHPDVDEKVKAMMHEFFQPYNEIFYKMCQKWFGW